MRELAQESVVQVCSRWCPERPRFPVGCRSTQPRGGCPSAGSRGVPLPWLSTSPAVDCEDLRGKSRSRSTLPVGAGPGVSRAGRCGTRTGATGQIAGDWIGWMGPGSLSFGRRTHKLRRRSSGGEAVTSPPFLSGGSAPLLPSPSLDSRGSSTFVRCESQPTPNRRPPALLSPLVEVCTDFHFSLQSTRKAGYNPF